MALDITYLPHMTPFCPTRLGLAVRNGGGTVVCTRWLPGPKARTRRGRLAFPRVAIPRTAHSSPLLGPVHEPASFRPGQGSKTGAALAAGGTDLRNVLNPGLGLRRRLACSRPERPGEGGHANAESLRDLLQFLSLTPQVPGCRKFRRRHRRRTSAESSPGFCGR